MNAKDFLEKEYKKDFNTRQLINGLDALFQEVLINIMDKFAIELSEQQQSSEISEQQETKALSITNAKKCKIIDLGESTAIICGNNSADHKCNEDAICYDTNEGRIFFENSEEARKWYDANYEKVKSGSVACSICGRASIDNAMWL